MNRLALVLALAGCDKLFDLEPVNADAGKTGDGARRDAAIDAFVCAPVGHDEDGDAVDDSCDRCPTFEPAAEDDSDGGGLPDACDRNDSPTGDKVLAYWTFPEFDLGDFTVAAQNAPGFTMANKGMVLISGDTTLATNASYPLTRVDFHVSAINMAGAESTLEVQVGTSPVCSISGASCDGASQGTCVKMGGNTTATWPLAPAAGRRISVYSSVAMQHCEIGNAVSENEVSVIGPLIAGSVGFAVDPTTAFRLEAIVIYGAK